MKNNKTKINVAVVLIVLICFFAGIADAAPRSKGVTKEKQATKTSSITTVGTGETKDDAIQDALRKAVERAMGVYIYSNTEVENFQVVKDKIIASSKGYVNNYKIVKEDQQEGIIFLTLDVDVNVNNIQTTVRENIKTVTFDDVVKDYALVKQRMDRIRKADEILKAIMNRPASEALNADFIGYKIVSIRRDKVLIQLSVRLSLNPFYWNTYYDIINHLAEDCGNSDVEKVYLGYKILRKAVKKDGGHYDWSWKKNLYFSFPEEKTVCLHVDTSDLHRSQSFEKVQIIGRFSDKGEKEDFCSFLPHGGELRHNVLKTYPTQGLNSEQSDYGPNATTIDLDGEYLCAGIVIDRKKGIIVKRVFSVKDPELIKKMKYLKFEVTELE